MPIFVDTYNYQCTHNGLYRKEVDEESGIVAHKYVARPIFIKEIIRLLDTEEVFWNVRFYFNDGWQEEIIARQNITERHVTLLLKKGADVGGWKTKWLVNYFYESEQKAPIVYQHKFLGWSKYKKRYFYAHQNTFMPNKSLNSEYVGNFNLAKKGCKDEWHQAIQKGVVGHSELELALCMGFSSILVGYINRRFNIHLDSLIFHLSGNSTTGKTSAATVAVASFGDPKEGAKSLIQNFNGTDNALVSLIANNHGVPIVCDETSLSLMPKVKLVNLLYSWAKNSNKARSDKNGDVRERLSWGTTIITTGEGSLLSQVNQNEGIRARIFEFKNLQWTHSADHSESLVEKLSKNYGHGVEPFVNYINNALPVELFKIWKSEVTKMSELLPTSKFNRRISRKFALIIMTATILNQVFQFGLDTEKIGQLLLTQEQESLEERAIGEKAYEQLREWILTNNSKFYVNKEQVPSGMVWGRINVNRKEGFTTVFILPKQFQRFLEEYGYSDETVVLRELKQLGCLITEKSSNQNKYFTRRVIRGEENKKNGVKVFGVTLEGIPVYVPLSNEEIQTTHRKPSSGNLMDTATSVTSSTPTYTETDIDDM